MPGRVEADIIEAEPIFRTEQGRLVRAHGMPPRLESFAAHGIDIHAVLSQAADDGYPDTEVGAPRTAASA